MSLLQATLRPGLLFLASEERKKTDTTDLHDLEPNTRDVTNGMTRSAETGDEDLVVLFNEIQTTIARDERGDFLTIFDQLDTARLTNGGIRLLRFNADPLKNNSLRMGGTIERICFQRRRAVFARVPLVMPFLFTAMSPQLASALDSSYSLGREVKT